jgi:hypothetical protein
MRTRGKGLIIDKLLIWKYRAVWKSFSYHREWFRKSLKRRTYSKRGNAMPIYYSVRLILKYDDLRIKLLA